MTGSRQEEVAATARPGRDVVRARILEAAAEEFAERGFAAARLAEIARRAGFTKGAVYSNFESKQDLFAELFAQRSLELAGRVLAEIAGLALADAVGKGGAAVAAALIADSEWSLLVLEFGVQAVRDPSIKQAYIRERRYLRSRLVELIADRAREWGVDIDVRTTALSLTALISGLVLEHTVDPEDVDQQAIGAAVTALFAGAVARAEWNLGDVR
ncbi:TetR/AcrR family transcriptional regulator [Prescottella agglutinans]|uniref:TetR/AcrR family transcriptional regulator n=1 Tax=Prescottella agglutinans TaxID=1644129 RepID=UPI001F4F0104|nr:TetR/AcrR family transcriptional regulator [Prescottella agglutinans]